MATSPSTLSERQGNSGGVEQHAIPEHGPFKVVTTRIVGLLAIAVTLSASPRVHADEPVHQAFEMAWLDAVIQGQLTDRGIPGAAAALVQDGEVRLARGYGLASIDEGRNVTEHTLFRIGSITKLFVWTSLFRLAEQGKLGLDDDVSKHLCGHTIASGYPEPIRVRHLMDHTAGFDARRRGTYARVPAGLVALETLVEKETPPIVRPPGTVEAYSNIGTCVGARVVECVSDKNFETFVQEQTFDPLGMRDSTLAQPLPPAKHGAMARGYVFQANQLEERPFEFIRMAPAGSMSASARDMAEFMRALLGANPAWMTEEALERMWTGSHVPNPHLGGMAHGFFVNQHHGLRVFWHGGDTSLFHSLLLLVPEMKLGLFVTYNGPEGADAYREVMQAVLERIKPSPQTRRLEWILPTDAEGSYRSSRVAKTTHEKLEARSGDWKVHRDGDGIRAGGRRWFPVAPWVFHERNGSDRLVFDVNERGEVERLRVASRPMQVFERVRGVEAAIAPWMVEIVLAAGAVGPLVSMVRERRRGGKERRDWRERGVLVSAVTGLVVLVLMNVMGRQDKDAWQFETPVLVWVVRGCLGVLVVMALMSGVGLWGGRRGETGRIASRWWSMGMVAAVLVWAARWGLVW